MIGEFCGGQWLRPFVSGLILGASMGRHVSGMLPTKFSVTLYFSLCSQIGYFGNSTVLKDKAGGRTSQPRFTRASGAVL